MISYARTAGPASEPVTLADFKAHSKVEVADDDAYITSLITAAREHLSTATGRAMINETWTATLDDWPKAAPLHDWWDGVRDGALNSVAAGYVEITKAPFAAVTAVNLLDEDGTPTLWAASNYYTTQNHGFGRLTLRRGAVWPVRLRDTGGIQITFTAGYGAAANAVPLVLRQGILMLMAHWYENREVIHVGGANAPMPAGLNAIIASMRVGR